MSGRGWTPNDDDPRWEEEAYYDRVAPQCNDLARRWSVLTTQAEQDGWRRQSDREEGRGYDPGEDRPRPRDYDLRELDPEYLRDVAAYDAELEAFEAGRRLDQELQEAQVRLIETKLQELGARMMRPYEHWNEDERLVAYLERDR